MRNSLCINQLTFTMENTLHMDCFVCTLNILNKTTEKGEKIFSLEWIGGDGVFMKCYSVGWGKT